MEVFCVDDTEFHLGKITKVIEQACAAKGISDCEIVQCCDGKDFLNKVSGKLPVLVTLDINMPNMDGLSTLVRYRHLNPAAKILMVSSENEAVVQRLASEHHKVDEKKKQMLLSSVISRVKSGEVVPGKINSVLEAVASLGMDPLKVARENGASDIVKKPFDVEKAVFTVTRYLK
ncbi:MAG: response regulator [SAR324 cluster bacterium]|nr:response regulator [SAR324 cluster bacterium]